MVLAELHITSLYRPYLELLGLLPPALVRIRRREVGNIGQRGGMVLARPGCASTECNDHDEDNEVRWPLYLW
ncbi:hypothetical protein N7460_009997 [Penicillium canescens]|uniref:Uncharacterized protein n=1 Tax=Penicillium canescens TaxID=5083 RepID=A0AAD6I525_PENCN|nr:hypothetical protein N7460_009997 [Penicillium canescens]KAJ6042958.1 hypothetical protein N7444_008222 [Penicillium canescens]